MQIRRELGERKLVSAARDAEVRAQQLQRRLDDAHNQLKRWVCRSRSWRNILECSSTSLTHWPNSFLLYCITLIQWNNNLELIIYFCFYFSKEKEFEETMDHLQQDIDSLENERGALREKLKLYAKRGTHHGENISYMHIIQASQARLHPRQLIVI